MKGKNKRILTWVFVVFCAFMALGMALNGGIIGGILMFAVAVVSLPIKQVQEIWTKILETEPIEDLPEEEPEKFWQLKKKKEQKKRQRIHAAKIQAQKNRRELKPTIIALLLMMAVGVYLAETDVDTVNEESQTAYVETAEASTEAPSITAEPEKTGEETTETPKKKAIQEETTAVPATESAQTVSLKEIPAYSDAPYVAVNDNVPYFTDSDLTTSSYEYYSKLDSLGRCGMAIANIGQDTMSTEKRGAIGSVKPTGWHTVKYDIVDEKYLYNRCHLISYQLSGENANKKNLITGTRYLNVEGMLPFENMVADYVEETDNHVLYRVTPVFDGDSLVASGVLMEAMSVEDEGDGILFNVYCYNVQPGVTIDYETGDSCLDEDSATETPKTTAKPKNKKKEKKSTSSSGTTYILNTSTKKFHYPGCSSVDLMSDENKEEYTGNRDDLISQGYSPCGNCNP